MDKLIGQDIGRYHLVEQLGEGGMASVYKAYDTRLDRYVAVKVILSSQQSSATFLKRFEREAKALAKLSHPNIVNIHDYGEDKGVPYLVMEYLPGGTLKSKMGAPIPYQEAVRLLLPIAQALEYAHSHKIIHRDIKPANILLTDSGIPMLSDFGIAKVLSGDQGTELTGVGVGIGTPEYMSPEQGQGFTADNRSDIYSLGVVFYELVTGRKPFRADTPLAVILKHISEPLPRPRQFVPDLPEDVERTIFTALAKDPKQRYQDMGAFAAALEKLIRESPTQGVALESETVLRPRTGTVSPASQPLTGAVKAETPQTPAGVSQTGMGVPRTTTAVTGTTMGGTGVSGTVAAPQARTGGYATPYGAAVVPPVTGVGPKPKSGWQRWRWWIIGGAVVLVALCVIIGISSGAFILLTSGGPTATTVALAEVTNTPETPVDTFTAEIIATETPQNTSQPTATSMPRPTDTLRPTEVHSPHINSIDAASKAFDAGNVDSLAKRAVETYDDATLNRVPHTVTYTVNLLKSEPLLWMNGWCATTSDILNSNLKNITFEFVMNGVTVEPSMLAYKQGTSKSGLQCVWYFVLLDQWPIGKQHLINRLNILQPLNDGSTDFQRGTMTELYEVGVAAP